VKWAQNVALLVAIGCGGAGLLTATGCPVLGPGDPGVAPWLHLLVIVVGAAAGFCFSFRAREIDAERWRVVDDSTITKGEREYAHKEAEREKKSAGVVFLMAPLTLGFWLAAHFFERRVVATDLLSLSPLLGFLLGLGGAKVARRGTPEPGAPR
jgi:hypothetical protein